MVEIRDRNLREGVPRIAVELWELLEPLGQGLAVRCGDFVLSGDQGRFVTDFSGFLGSESVPVVLRLEQVVAAGFHLQRLFLVLEQIDLSFLDVAECEVELAVVARKAWSRPIAVLEVHPGPVIGDVILHLPVRTIHPYLIYFKI